MYKGLSFFNKAIIGLVPRHLNVVIEVEGDTFTLINFTTGKDGVGRYYSFHNWRKIDRPSQIAWGMERKVHKEDILFMMRRGLMQVTENCPPDLLRLISSRQP